MELINEPRPSVLAELRATHKMSAETQLPLIKVERIFARDKRPERAENRLVWGTQLKLSQEDSHLWKLRAATSRTARPLGMLPHKRKGEEWRGLSLLASERPHPLQVLQKPQKPVISGHRPNKPLPQSLRHHHHHHQQQQNPQQYHQEQDKQQNPSVPLPSSSLPPPPPPATSNEESRAVISASVIRREKPAQPMLCFPASNVVKPLKQVVIEDEEYLDVLAQVDMHHLYSSELESKHFLQRQQEDYSIFPPVSIHQDSLNYKEAKHNLSNGSRKLAKWGRYVHRAVICINTH